MPATPSPVNPPQQRLHAVVYGDVQGVGFRAFTQREAVRLGLTGWVRNTRDETVETVAEGPRHALDEFERALRVGPRSAFVDRVEVTVGDATGEFSGFHVRY